MKLCIEIQQLILTAASALLLAACGGNSGNIGDGNGTASDSASMKQACPIGSACAAAATTYTVSASGTNLAITSSNPKQVGSGSQASFSVTANDGHVILNNSIGGTCAPGSWTGNVYTTGPVTANCTVVFGASTGTIRYSAAPGNGEQGHAGTLADPYRTIWENFKAAQPGDVIYLQSGVFTEECPYFDKPNDPQIPYVIMGAGTIPAKGAPTSGGTSISCNPKNPANIPTSAKTGAVYMVPSYVTIQNLTIGPSPISGSGLFLNSYNNALCSNVVVDHVTIYNSIGAGYQSVLCGALTLTNSVFYGNGFTYTRACTSGISLGGNIDDGTSKYDNIVNGNVSYNNGNPAQCNGGVNSDGEGIIIDYGPDAPCASFGTPPGNFKCATVSRTLVSNNILYGNQGAGIEVFNGNNVDIINNTLYQNQAVTDHQSSSMGDIMIAAVTGSNASSVTVYNNLIVPLTTNPAISCSNFSNVTMQNNFNGNTAAKFINPGACANVTRSGNVTGNPAFVNPAAPNFALQSTSAARRVGKIVPGTDWTSWLDIDYTGAARSAGVAPDAGACKYTATPPGTCP